MTSKDYNPSMDDLYAMKEESYKEAYYEKPRHQKNPMELVDLETATLYGIDVQEWQRLYNTLCSLTGAYSGDLESLLNQALEISFKQGVDYEAQRAIDRREKAKAEVKEETFGISGAL